MGVHRSWAQVVDKIGLWYKAQLKYATYCYITLRLLLFVNHAHILQFVA